LLSWLLRQARRRIAQESSATSLEDSSALSEIGAVFAAFTAGIQPAVRRLLRSVPTTIQGPDELDVVTRR
jgi:hypothetical protein